MNPRSATASLYGTRLPRRQVLQRVQEALSWAGRPPLPRSLRFDRYVVTRHGGRVAIHFIEGEAERARFDFAPCPRLTLRG